MARPVGFMLAAAATVVVAATIGVSLYMAGGPRLQRERAADARRVDDLRALTEIARLYRTQRGAWPPSVAELAPGDRPAPALNDPITGAPYEYRVVGDTVEVCAVFQHESDRTWRGEFWAHRSGRQCFTARKQP